MPDNIQCPGVTVATARTLRLRASSTPPLWGVRLPAIPQSWVPKSPTDVLEYALDPVRWLADSGDVLDQITAIVPDRASDADLTVLWAAKVNGLAVVCLAGGLPGTTVPVQVSLKTVSGRQHTERVFVVINADSSAQPVTPGPTLPDGSPIPPNAIRLPDGSILTTDDNRPLLLA